MKVQYYEKFLDLNKREFVCFVPLIIGTLLLGICLNIVLNPIHISVNHLVELMYF